MGLEIHLVLEMGLAEYISEDTAYKKQHRGDLGDIFYAFFSVIS